MDHAGRCASLDKLLAIFDTDTMYTMRFLEYFKKKGISGFEITAFSVRESLENFLRDRKVEILLLGDGLKEEELEKDKAKYIFYLDDKNLAGAVSEKNILYKYQSAGKLLSDLLSSYTRLEHDTEGTENCLTKIVSLFSPVPGRSKLLFAWSLAYCLSVKKKVLFILLDPLPVPGQSAAYDSDSSLSEYIYYLKENNTNLTMKIKQLLKFTEKLTYLTGLSHGFDLLSISREDAVRWAEELRTHTDYERVIFYLGLYTEATMEIMNLSDYNYILSSENSYEGDVIKEWQRQMSAMDMDTASSKSILLSLSEEMQPDKIQQIAQQCTDILCR